MSERTYYCFCANNCRFETMSKEQILSAIAQAQSGMPVIDPSAGVLTKVKETNNGGHITFWVGTQAQYNALQGNTVQNCLYIITDDTTGEDMNKEIEDLKRKVADIEKVGIFPSLWNDVKINLASTTGTLQLSSDMSHFQYAPTARAVFFTVYLYIYGHIAAGETVKFQLENAPLRFIDAWEDALCCVHDDGNTKAGKLEATCSNWGSGISGRYAKPQIKLRAKEEFESTSAVKVIVSGFYFSEGNGRDNNEI